MFFSVFKYVPFFKNKTNKSKSTKEAHVTPCQLSEVQKQKKTVWAFVLIWFSFPFTWLVVLLTETASNTMSMIALPHGSEPPTEEFNQNGSGHGKQGQQWRTSTCSIQVWSSPQWCHWVFLFLSLHQHMLTPPHHSKNHQTISFPSSTYFNFSTSQNVSISPCWFPMLTVLHCCCVICISIFFCPLTSNLIFTTHNTNTWTLFTKNKQTKKTFTHQKLHLQSLVCSTIEWELQSFSFIELAVAILPKYTQN